MADINAVEVSAAVVNLAFGSAGAVAVRIAKTVLTVRKPWSRMASCLIDRDVSSWRCCVPKIG